MAHYDHPSQQRTIRMRPEIEKAVEEIQQVIGLLRRHL
jgi:hypothetical protein